MNLIKELYGCEQYIKLSKEALDYMPIYVRREYIRLFNEDKDKEKQRYEALRSRK